jgi:hypothetical protein
MTDHTKLIERLAERYGVPDLSTDHLLRRRDRKRRNQRVAAGVVGIAVFVAAVWIVTGVGSLDRSDTSVVPGGDVTGPSETTAEAGWDGFGFPPDELTPSTPVEGKVIAEYAEIHVGWVYVYADGRVLWFPGRKANTDGPIFEQHLTPEGIHLVRAGDLYAAAFLDQGSNPVPAGALADTEIKPYVPARYAICFSSQDFVDGLVVPSEGTAPAGVIDTVDPSTVVDQLPAAARDLLVGKEHTYGRRSSCYELTTEDARALVEILRDAGVGSVLDDGGERLGIGVLTLLPHGIWQGWAY